MSEPAPRVVELSSPFARFAGRLLVGLGHEVVLVEPPKETRPAVNRAVTRSSTGTPGSAR